MTPDDALRAAQRALKRLARSQGRIARRNARALVKRHVRKLLALYPMLKKEQTKPRRRPRTHLERARSLLAKNYVAVSPSNQDFLLSIIECGIPNRRIGEKIYVPKWAWDIGVVSKSKLREAVKSPSARTVILTELALEKSG